MARYLVLRINSDFEMAAVRRLLRARHPRATQVSFPGPYTNMAQAHWIETLFNRALDKAKGK